MAVGVNSLHNVTDCLSMRTRFRAAGKKAAHPFDTGGHLHAGLILDARPKQGNVRENAQLSYSANSTHGLHLYFHPTVLAVNG